MSFLNILTAADKEPPKHEKIRPGGKAN